VAVRSVERGAYDKAQYAPAIPLLQSQPVSPYELSSTLVAYTGTYRVEGDKWITKVEVAWNPEWVGTEQVRSFKVENGRLQVLTPWRVMPNWADKGMTRSIVTFERAK
jgi:hypothetical protein